MIRLNSTVALLLLLQIVGVPAAYSASSQKDAVAVANVELAIKALGGDAAVLAIKDSVITCTSTPASGSWMKPGTFTWKTLGGEARIDVTRGVTSQIFVTGFGQPAVSKNGQVSALFYHVAESFSALQLPAVVLSSKLADPTFAMADGGTVQISGQEALEVKLNSSASDSDASITQQTWYIAASTGLPLRVEFQIPDTTDMSQPTAASMDFADYKQVGSLLVPFTMTYSESGVALETYSISTVDFNVGLDPAEFTLLGGKK